MKSLLRILPITLICICSALYTQAQTACNPLTLNGKPLDTEGFSVLSKGMLSWGKATISTDLKDSRVPFIIYLKRGNDIIENALSSATKAVYEIEVGQILRSAQYGDELIVEPATKDGAKSRQVLKLHKYLMNYNFITRRDGC